MTDLPLNTPTKFEVKRVEIKKQLPARGDFPARAVLRLGLETDGAKGWAEHVCDWEPQGAWPGEGSTQTYILAQDGSNTPVALRPSESRSRGFSKAAEGRATQAMIVAQSARTAALAELELALGVLDHASLPDNLTALRNEIDDRVAAITSQAIAIGNLERLEAEENA